MYITLMNSECRWIGIGQTKEKALEAIVKKYNNVLGESKTIEELANYYGICCLEVNDGDCFVL